MTDRGIPRVVQEFLADRIRSYEQLELLLLAHKSASPTSAKALGEKLGISPDVAEGELEALCAKKLLTKNGVSQAATFVYAPADADLRLAVDDLARAYEENRLGIVTLMTKNAIDRVRTSAIETFADSFVVGKGKKDG